jgi:hypothetical protein
MFADNDQGRSFQGVDDAIPRRRHRGGRSGVCHAAFDLAAHFDRIFNGNQTHFVPGFDDVQLGFRDVAILPDHGKRFLFVNGEDALSILSIARLRSENDILDEELPYFQFHP